MFLENEDAKKLFDYYSEALEQIFAFYATSDRRTHASMASGGLTATSNVNLVQNVGFGDVATHTVVRHEYLRPVEPIRLPTEAVPVEVDERADAWTRRHHFKATVPGFIVQGTRYVRRRLGRHS